VTYLSVAYMSLINLNKNNVPSSSPAPWSITTTYALGNIVAGSDGYPTHRSANGNVAKDPSTDNGTNWANGAGWCHGRRCSPAAPARINGCRSAAPNSPPAWR
jgi:hypothetical protein